MTDFWSFHYFQALNHLSANPTNWLNALKQFIGKQPTNCLSVFDHFMELELKGLSRLLDLIWHTTLNYRLPPLY